MFCTGSRPCAGFRCVLDQFFPLFASIFRLCLTSLLNRVSGQKTPRVLKFVLLIASTQQRRVRAIQLLSSSTLILRLASIADCVLTSVQCRRSFQRMTCPRSGTSTSRSTQTGSRSRNSKNFSGPGDATKTFTQTDGRRDHSESVDGLLTPLMASGFSVQS